MKINNDIGIFIQQKRIEKQISLRSFSRQIEISAEYLSKIENGLRPAPNVKVLEKISTQLLLSPQETEILYDLAAESKSYLSLASDLLVYITENKSIHKALRLAKRCGANEDDWQFFVEFLTNKYL
ncbi:MAG: helix-turn-helix transcriptional regulator [Oscillospiraceae bacterium]|nr:helix-turn-helix transcriptional regulator [Oscillospiraceae bacterium]